MTAPGGGADVIPFLKTYVQLPGAILFTIAYSKMCNLMSPDKVVQSPAHIHAPHTLGVSSFSAGLNHLVHLRLLLAGVLRHACAFPQLLRGLRFRHVPGARRDPPARVHGGAGAQTPEPRSAPRRHPQLVLQVGISGIEKKIVPIVRSLVPSWPPYPPAWRARAHLCFSLNAETPPLPFPRSFPLTVRGI